jgi:hypothetical protein
MWWHISALVQLSRRHYGGPWRCLKHVLQLVCTRQVAPANVSRRCQMQILKCIVTCTWYCFQTFTHSGSHTSILSYTRSCTNGNLHEWFLSLKYAIRIHTNQERMDTSNVFASNQAWQNNDRLYSHMYASTLVWNMHNCTKLTLTPMHDG